MEDCLSEILHTAWSMEALGLTWQGGKTQNFRTSFSLVLENFWMLPFQFTAENF